MGKNLMCWLPSDYYEASFELIEKAKKDFIEVMEMKTSLCTWCIMDFPIENMMFKFCKKMTVNMFL